jgi:hypothetical protein
VSATEYRPGFYRLRGCLGRAEAGTLVHLLPDRVEGVWAVHLPDGLRRLLTPEASLDLAGAERVDNP